MRFWRRKKKWREVYVPSDYEFLDPDRPEIRYESDLTPEERERIGPKLEELRRRNEEHRRRVKEEHGIDLGPPWTIRYPDGTEVVVGEDPAEEPEQSAEAGEPDEEEQHG